LIEKIDASRAKVRSFGLLFAGLASCAAAWSGWKGGAAWEWLLPVALIFLVLAITGYPLLRPVYLGWMTFAFILGWVNTRLLLGLFFYLVLTPVGTIRRLFGKDPLARKFDREAVSYWEKRLPEKRGVERYERLF
jgi:hypothetical protein